MNYKHTQWYTIHTGNNTTAVATITRDGTTTIRCQDVPRDGTTTITK